MKKSLIFALLCGLAPLAALAAEPGSLALTDAWVRALPPGQPNTAAYLTITNEGQAAVRIVGASTALAQKVEFHTTREVDGLQRMEQLAEVAVGPGQSLAFAPGGMHLMLFGLAHMPAPGEAVQLCLQLAAGGEVCATAEVRKTAAAQPSHEHHQH